jgi:hypothetical protein
MIHAILSVLSLMKNLLFLAFCALILTSTEPSARADRMKPIAVETLAARADWILQGTVLSISSQKDAEGRIYTKVELQVDEAWKGTVTSNRFTIVHGGGVVGDEQTSVSGQVEFKVGEEVVVYLVRNPRGDGVCIGLSQGKFKVTRDASGQKTVKNPFHGQGSDDGPAPGRNGKLSLNELKQRSQKSQ